MQAVLAADRVFDGIDLTPTLLHGQTVLNRVRHSVPKDLSPTSLDLGVDNLHP